MGHRASPGRASRLVWDTPALVSVQVPICAAILWAGGAEGPEVVRGCLRVTAIMVVAGRPYGLWLDLVRSWFGLPPGGARSTSPQG